MFRYFRVIPAALLTALLAVALVSCGGGEESVSSVAPSSSAVSAADPSEASATDTFSASSATLTSEEAPALTPAEDPYAVRRKMMVPADTEEGFRNETVILPLSLLHSATPEQIVGHDGTSRLPVSLTLTDASLLFVVDYDDGFRLVLDDMGFDTETLSEKSTGDLKVWDVRGGNVLFQMPEASFDGGILLFDADAYAESPARRSRVMGSAADADGDIVQVHLNSIDYLNDAVAMQYGVPFDEDADIDVLSVTARETVLRNYGFIRDVLTRWGYLFDGTTLESEESLRAYLTEYRRVYASDTGKVCISVGEDEVYGPVTWYLSADCEHILAMTAGKDMAVYADGPLDDLPYIW